jgi:hypothetical protein
VSEYRRDDWAHRSVRAGAIAYGAAMTEPAPDASAEPVRQLRVAPLAGAAPARPASRARKTSHSTPSHIVRGGMQLHSLVGGRETAAADDPSLRYVTEPGERHEIADRYSSLPSPAPPVSNGPRPESHQPSRSGPMAACGIHHPESQDHVDLRVRTIRSLPYGPFLAH